LSVVSAFLAALSLGAVFALQARAATEVTPDPRDAPGRQETVYRYISSPIYVVDEGTLRYLRFGTPQGVDQSILDLDDPNRLAMPYLRPAALAAEIPEATASVLIVGMGGGGFTRYLRHRFPEATIDAVEIDAEVIEVSRRFFQITAGPRLHIHQADGAEYLQRLSVVPGGRYDLIFLDAYDGDRIPEPLTTDRFLASVHRQLRDQGLVISNVGKDDLKTYQARFERMFPACARMRTWLDENAVLVGSKTRLPDGRAVLAGAQALDASEKRNFLYTTIARTWTHCRDGATR
jgi:predicted O-methyltransferase YrrM